jgi:hypothetical protein
MIRTSSCQNFAVVPEAGGNMDRHVAVPLLKTVVFANVVQVITSDDEGALHLQLLDDTSQDATSDRDIASEGALLVNVASLNSLGQGIYC